MKSAADFTNMVVALPDGILASVRFRVSLRLCTAYDRADAFARKTMVSPELLRFADGTAGIAPGAAGQQIPPVVLWGGLAFAIIVLLLGVSLLLFK